jgi:hypothetical protein
VKVSDSWLVFATRVLSGLMVVACGLLYVYADGPGRSVSALLGDGFRAAVAVYVGVNTASSVAKFWMQRHDNGGK